MNPMSPKTRYIMVGGFLGAGKTTAILSVAEILRRRGLRVGLITNDQSYGLVDTAMLNSHGFAVQEITGGCFCCRFNSLIEASQKLTAEAMPDTFIAEPVGSCTDLKATVDYPLRRIYGDDYAVAPLSVLVDPIRAERILGLGPGKSFSRKVTYIYQKQLEEADIIVINKIDLLDAGRLEELCRALQSRFPQAVVLTISARTGQGLEQWIEQITSAKPKISGAMDVDYETYAQGEALLGWLNCTARLDAAAGPFDGNALLIDLASRVRSALREAGAEVAHLKMTLAPEGSGSAMQDLAVANLVRSDGETELSHQLQAPLESGQIILNLRAEADPELLRQVVESALTVAAATAALTSNIEHLESFRPGKPTPTHRLAEV
jgi:G3E family GTPase